VIVRWYWPSCDYRQRKWGATPIDAFWLEATEEEVVQSVFPRLSRKLQAESRRWASESQKLAEIFLLSPRTSCFLLARDLSSIDPYVIYYPFHQQWNAYSPFHRIPVRTITSL
jgi:hypothetical protein